MHHLTNLAAKDALRSGPGYSPLVNEQAALPCADYPQIPARRASAPWSFDHPHARPGARPIPCPLHRRTVPLAGTMSDLEGPTSPPHSVYINQTAKSRKAVLPERDTHEGDKPSCMTDSQWETMQPALKVRAPTATLLQAARVARGAPRACALRAHTRPPNSPLAGVTCAAPASSLCRRLAAPQPPRSRRWMPYTSTWTRGSTARSRSSTSSHRPVRWLARARTPMPHPARGARSRPPAVPSGATPTSCAPLPRQASRPSGSRRRRGTTRRTTA